MLGGAEDGGFGFAAGGLDGYAPGGLDAGGPFGYEPGFGEEGGSVLLAPESWRVVCRSCSPSAAGVLAAVGSWLRCAAHCSAARSIHQPRSCAGLGPYGDAYGAGDEAGGAATFRRRTAEALRHAEQAASGASEELDVETER